jgi:hypothetical protein
MVELVLGAVAAVAFLLLVQYAKSNALPVRWWQWVLTVLGFLYAVFVAEVIVAFVREGTPKGAAVMGAILGFVAVVWGVLLARFAFAKGVKHAA